MLAIPLLKYTLPVSNGCDFIKGNILDSYDVVGMCHYRNIGERDYVMIYNGF